MAWRDELHLGGEGEFRGVRFYVSSAEGSIGRRTVVHEFPGRDQPFTEDNGRKARSFSFDAYIIGPEYMGQRDALIEAIETEGPGKLIHPYWGEMRVVVTGEVRISETTASGGMARFQIPVREAGSEPSPLAKVDTSANVVTSCTAASTALGGAFENGFSLSGAIGFVRDSALGTINRATSTLNAVRGQIAASLAIIDDTAGAIDAFGDTLSDLIETPLDLATQFTGLVTSVFAAIAQVGASIDAVAGRFRVDTAMGALRELMEFGEEEEAVPDTTPQRLIQAANQAQIIALVRASALIEAGRIIPNLEFESFDQASATRDELSAFVDDVTGLIDSDDLYFALSDLRAALVRHLDQAASALPDIIDFTPPQTMPAILVAHRLYGDPERDAEIVARNRISNPSSVTGLVALKVLDA